MLSCCNEGGFHCFLQLRVTFIIIRRQCFLNPFYIVRLTFSCQLNGIGERQRHVTINH